ncbi:MAG: pentapeptide repeat-containing protein [Proteobacteria bacterium]|nr:hypothetical protein [Pseudomonadota bacterium]NOG61049.1 pentapeptide repeat-containing protein [Pseudomonadota bacterium]
MASPKVLDDEMYQLLRMGEIDEFNEKRDISVEYDLSGSDLSRIDIRGLIVDNINFEDAYFRMTDMRGVDFRNSKMEGASFAGANISGCYFPKELRADEILFSLEHGTRVRYSRPGSF